MRKLRVVTVIVKQVKKFSFAMDIAPKNLTFFV